MRTRRAGLLRVVVSVGIALSIGRSAWAIDAWDKGVPDDDAAATGTELVHGSDEVHDLQARGGADEDWYRIAQQPYASYEVVVDAATPTVLPVVLERIGADGTTVAQSSVAIGAGIGGTRSLRWENATANAIENETVRVTAGGCGARCKKTATYRIRAYETTYAVPRFNNSGTQVTVLVVQNPQSYQIAGNVWFWDATGTQIATSTFDLTAKAVLVLQTQLVTPATSGTITISHGGRFGDLAGKSIALEPATGFSFDTPLVPRPR